MAKASYILRVQIDDLTALLSSPILAKDTITLIKTIIANGGKVIVLQKYINALADLHSVIATEDQLEAFIKR